MLCRKFGPAILFFALFPASFFYNTLVATGVIGQVIPGGGWTITHAVGLLVLGPLALRSVWRTERSDFYVHTATAMLVTWVVGYAVFYKVFGVGFQRDARLFIEAGILVCGWGGFYTIGFLFRPTKVFASAVTVALATMVIITFLILNTDALFSQRIGGAAYAWLGNALVFTAIFSLALTPVWMQPVILAAALGGLLTIGARSEFFGFAFVSLLWTIFMLRRRRFAIAASGVTASIVIVLVLLKAPFGMESFSTKRVLEVTEPGTSMSLGIRSELLRRGWAEIQRAPFLGVYGGHMRPPEGHVGNYIHNALSAWHQFGLIPFVIYLGLATVPVALAAWVIFIERSNDRMLALTFYTGAFAMFLIMAAKSVYWSPTALAWGLFAGLLSRTGGIFRRARSPDAR